MQDLVEIIKMNLSGSMERATEKLLEQYLISCETQDEDESYFASIEDERSRLYTVIFPPILDFF